MGGSAEGTEVSAVRPVPTVLTETHFRPRLCGLPTRGPARGGGRGSTVGPQPQAPGPSSEGSFLLRPTGLPGRREWPRGPGPEASSAGGWGAR